MSSYDPTKNDIENAIIILEEICIQIELRTDDYNLQGMADKLLRVAYSIGCDYSVNCIRPLAESMFADIVEKYRL